VSFIVVRVLRMEDIVRTKPWISRRATARELAATEAAVIRMAAEGWIRMRQLPGGRVQYCREDVMNIAQSSVSRPLARS